MTIIKKSCMDKENIIFNQGIQTNVSEPLGRTVHQEEWNAKKKMAPFKIYEQEKGRTFPWCIPHPFTCHVWLKGFSFSKTIDVLVLFPQETRVTYISWIAEFLVPCRPESRHRSSGWFFILSLRLKVAWTLKHPVWRFNASKLYNFYLVLNPNLKY